MKKKLFDINESLYRTILPYMTAFHSDSRARESDIFSSGTLAVRSLDVHTFDSALQWFWRPTFWAVARPCLTVSSSRSKPLRFCTRWLKQQKVFFQTRLTFPFQVKHKLSYLLYYYCYYNWDTCQTCDYYLLVYKTDKYLSFLFDLEKDLERKWFQSTQISKARIISYSVEH